MVQARIVLYSFDLDFISSLCGSTADSCPMVWPPVRAGHGLTAFVLPDLGRACLNFFFLFRAAL